MAVEEQRRIALHRAAADSWGEEVADTLVELVAPSGHELATRADIETILAAMDAMDERWDERLAAMEQRWDERLAATDQQITAMDQRWDERLAAMDQRWDERLAAMDQRWDERLAAMDQQITAMDQRWDERLAAMDQQITAMDQRWAAEGRALRGELIGTFEHRVADAITQQTRVLTISLMLAIVAIAGLAFGLG